MYVQKPPMGWNSWNTFGPAINEEVVRGMADVMASEGYLEAGYEYLVIDDCWSLRKRGADGRICVDLEKFPSGMKALADYVHSKGLKFGMYSCVGTWTCAGFPGSFEHEFTDAATLAEWGVDFLKLDYCYKPGTEPGDRLYRRMALALDNCGRDILLSACSWGADSTHEWIKSTGASMWRSTGDIQDNWNSVKSLYEIQRPIYKLNGAGCFNDMDMLIVGMGGEGNVATDKKGCTLDEYRTHFAIWSLFGSPLMIGSDLRKISPECKEILLNKELIALDQDPAYRQPYNLSGNPNMWVRHLSDGDIVIAMINTSDGGSYFPAFFADLGLGRITGRGLQITDMWTGEDLGTFEELYTATVAPHATKMLRCKVVEV